MDLIFKFSEKLTMFGSLVKDKIGSQTGFSDDLVHGSCSMSEEEMKYEAKLH